jgi:hypothetical protein
VRRFKLFHATRSQTHRAATPNPTRSQSRSVAALYNSKMPASKSLAGYYASRPTKLIVGGRVSPRAALPHQRSALFKTPAVA